MIIKRKDPKFAALLAIVNAAARYQKHSIIVTIGDTIELHDTYWGGGSRSTYTLVDVQRAGAIRRFPQYAPNQFGGPKEPPLCVTIEPGCAIVETGFFCGKPSTAVVTLSQADFDAVPE